MPHEQKHDVLTVGSRSFLRNFAKTRFRTLKPKAELCLHHAVSREGTIDSVLKVHPTKCKFPSLMHNHQMQT